MVALLFFKALLEAMRKQSTQTKWIELLLSRPKTCEDVFRAKCCPGHEVSETATKIEDVDKVDK